jgi:hypothetical protein
LENNGNKEAKDYSNYASPDTNIGSCFREYRNTPKSVWAKVLYKDKILSLYIDIRQGGKAYTKCFESSIHLPTGYHFGISASTTNEGHDDHDFHSFETYELNPAPKKEQPLRPFEKEEMDKGHAFELDSKLMEKIKKTEEVVEEAQGDDDDDEELGNSMLSIAHLEQNQFHILEALNLIQDKLHIKPIDVDLVKKEDQDEFESRLGQQISSLK